MSEAAKKMIVLKSSDGETFDVEEATAVVSQTIKHMIDDDCVSTAIPIPNVTSDVLARVLEYCKKHTESPPAADKTSDHRVEELKKFDKDFVKVDQGMLFDLILAANYLDIKSLLDLTCQRAADNIKDKTVEEVRTIFNITNDFTPEEEEAVRNENAWAFE